MLKTLLASGLLLLLSVGACAAPAYLGQSGQWKVFGGLADDGTSVCGFATGDSAGRVVYFKFFDKTDFLAVQLYKPSWSIPTGKRVPAAMTFNGQLPWTFQGYGKETMISTTIAKENIASFMQEVEGSSFVQIHFDGGNESDMVFSMTGLNNIIAKFDECIDHLPSNRHDSQPFSQSGPSQPFKADF